MEQRTLGRDGARVSALALGTVSLGVEYGIDAPGNSGRPAAAEARGVLTHALKRGITFYDTAPAYGESEALLGEALGAEAAVFATKVTIPRDEHGTVVSGAELRSAIRGSIERSQHTLRRTKLDLVQIHNATVPLIESGELTRVLTEHVDRGHIGSIGASVYTVDEALAAIASGAFATIQVAYNLLDRRMAVRVFPAAAKAGVGVLVRSAYLKGTLTDKAEWLPAELAPLKAAVEALRSAAGVGWAELPRLALRYCLSHPSVTSVLVGARTEHEIDVAVAAAAEGPIEPQVLRAIEQVEVADERLLNPATWPVK